MGHDDVWTNGLPFFEIQRSSFKRCDERFLISTVLVLMNPITNSVASAR
jgi:hypothetical protein